MDKARNNKKPDLIWDKARYSAMFASPANDNTGVVSKKIIIEKKVKRNALKYGEFTLFFTHFIIIIPLSCSAIPMSTKIFYSC